MALPFLDRDRSQDGDDGVNAVFPVAHFDIVAEIMRPKRRRRLTPELRVAAVERLKQYRYPAAKRPENELERVRKGLDDRGAAPTL